MTDRQFTPFESYPNWELELIVENTPHNHPENDGVNGENIDGKDGNIDITCAVCIINSELLSRSGQDRARTSEMDEDDESLESDEDDEEPHYGSEIDRSDVDEEGYLDIRQLHIIALRIAQNLVWETSFEFLENHELAEGLSDWDKEVIYHLVSCASVSLDDHVLLANDPVYAKARKDAEGMMDDFIASLEGSDLDVITD